MAAANKLEIARNATKNGLGMFLEVAQFHEAFRKFLESEFTLENLTFYEKINEYKEVLKLDSDEESDMSASLRCSVAGVSFARIYDEFIAPGAKSELNLSSELRAELTAIMDEFHDDDPGASEETAKEYLEGLSAMVEKAQAEIFNLMTNDMFNRYVLSDSFKSLVKELEAEAS